MSNRYSEITQTGFSLENITVRQGTSEVLSDICCQITPGSAWGILGKSGSGKSTLLRLLAGLDVPDTGKIFLDGRLLSRHGEAVVRPADRNIAMVFQDLALWPGLTVLENVTLGRHGAHIIKQAEKSLETCGILHLAIKYPGELSGGEQQRLALARAITARPRYLFLDEPFNGLDLEIKRDISHYIAKLATENHITVLLVSHDPFEILTLCQKALVLENGKIAESGKLSSLLANPVSNVMKTFRAIVEETYRDSH